MDKTRNKNLDILRVFAAYLIVLLHLSVAYISTDIGTCEWWFNNFLSAFSRIGVPTFVMLTGAFLLDKEKLFDIKILFKKYIFKVVALFFVASFIYALIYVHNYWEQPMNFMDKIFWGIVIRGHYHQWYLYMIAGLYLLTPILRAFVKVAKDSEIIFFILLTIIFNMVTEYMQMIEVSAKSELIQYVTFSMRTHVFVGYAGFYVAGWYLKNHILKKKNAVAIYALGFIGYLLTVGLTGYVNLNAESLILAFYSNYSVTVFLTSIAVFLFFCRMKHPMISENKFYKLNAIPQNDSGNHNEHEKEEKKRNIIDIKKFKPYKYMMLVYIVHPFFIEYTKLESKTNLVIASIIIFAISFVTAVLLQTIYKAIKKVISFN